MPVHETDICIIGGGITSAMLAREAVRASPRASASPSSRPADRSSTRRTAAAIASARCEYGEHPWHDDYIEDQQADGIISMTMAVGGLALHWGGACNRFSEEDLRLKSMYGLADRLADRMGRARALLLRGGAAAERQRRAEPASRGSAVAALPAGPDPAVLQPADPEGVGREERRQVLAAADGAQPDAVRRPRQLLRATTPAARSVRRARATRPTSRSGS